MDPKNTSYLVLTCTRQGLGSGHLRLRLRPQPRRNEMREARSHLVAEPVPCLGSWGEKVRNHDPWSNVLITPQAYIYCTVMHQRYMRRVLRMFLIKFCKIYTCFERNILKGFRKDCEVCV
jgi:hypothetical protein